MAFAPKVLYDLWLHIEHSEAISVYGVLSRTWYSSKIKAFEYIYMTGLKPFACNPLERIT